MYYRGRCSAPLTHTIPICRRISNRESARRLRKQRNEKLNSLLSQQDNLQGINDCLKAQISAAREELSRLTDENRGMLTQLGENVCSEAPLCMCHTSHFPSWCRSVLSILCQSTMCQCTMLVVAYILLCTLCDHAVPSSSGHLCRIPRQHSKQPPGHSQNRTQWHHGARWTRVQRRGTGQQLCQKDHLLPRVVA